MSLVDSAEAVWLKSEGSSVTARDGAITAAWGDAAIETKAMSALALEADAAAEAARQLAFLAPPSALDAVWVPGRRADLIGRSVQITATGGGYGAGVTVLVVGVDETRADGGTLLTVLRRL